MGRNGSGGNLLKHAFWYERCLDWVASLSGSPSECLEAIAHSARVAWLHHPGRFADGALENYLLAMGHEQLRPTRPEATPLRWEKPRSATSLHVATEIQPVGGHSRVLAKWIWRDTSSNHVVVITRQRGAVPEFFEDLARQSNAAIVRLNPDDSATRQASVLRELAERCNRVVLHTHPHDPVPVLAFARPGGPPVAMYNHAHFSFSLTAGVADIIVNGLPYFQSISERLRFAQHTAILTTVPGVTRLTAEPIDKDEAKRSVGIDPSHRVVLSIGQEQYYRPSAGYDFFQTASKLLGQNPTTHLVVVGVRPDSLLVPSDLKGEPRCHFLGPVVDPRRYYRAADVSLESFPFPSLGGAVEAVVYGEAFPIPVYGPTESILRVSQAPALAYRHRPADEAEYLSCIKERLSDLGEARAHARQARAALVTLDDEWDERLVTLNREIDRLKHRPSELPLAAMSDSPDSRVLADLAPIDLAQHIDHKLPLRLIAGAYFTAARRRLVTGRRILGWAGRRGLKREGSGLARASS